MFVLSREVIDVSISQSVIPMAIVAASFRSMRILRYAYALKSKARDALYPIELRGR